jgi:hypothetical protein
MEGSLKATARAYVAKMTSIRGRRVHRLLMRELSRFAHVLPVTAQDGTPALFAVDDDGSVRVCRTDGRGAAAAVAEWARLEGATITISYDLLKDSLPIVSWTIWHPSFDRIAGALTISGADVPRADHGRITDILRSAVKP